MITCRSEETRPTTVSTLLRNIFKQLNSSTTRPSDGKMHECLLEMYFCFSATSEKEVSDWSCRVNIQHLRNQTWRASLLRKNFKEQFSSASLKQLHVWRAPAICQKLCCVFLKLSNDRGCIFSVWSKASRLDAAFTLNRFGCPQFLGAAAA